MRTRAIPLLLALAVAVPPAGATGGTAMWSVTSGATGGMTIVSGSRSGTVVAVVSGGNLLASSDFGVTWLPVATPPPNGGSSQTRVAVASPKRWFAENGIAVTTSADGGTTWQPIAPPPVVKNPAQRFEFADEIAAADGSSTALLGWAGARVIGLCPHAFTFTPLFTTHNAGRTWRRTDLPVAGSTWSASWLDSKRAAVVLTELDWSEPEGDDDGCESTGTFVATSVWVTSDGGARWKRVLRSPDIWYATASWTSPTSIAVVAEANGIGRSYVSKNAGRTFAKPLQVYATGVDAQRVNGFPALDFADDRRGWVDTILSGVFRTDNGGTEWVHEPSPADGGFYGVPDFTALNRDRAVVAGPWSVNTRHGEAPVAPFSGPVLGAPDAPETLVQTVVHGGVRREVRLPAFGPPSVTVRVSR